MSQNMEPVQLPAPGRIGQGTVVEQTRAAAEVAAAVRVAQQCPRDMQVSRSTMQDSCKQFGLAERAFFRFPRGGQTVTGPTIHLARELARCFGNIQYGIAELRRDDEAGLSEMVAFAWDVQTNTRTSNTFIVPHLRDKRGGAEKLTDVRDIYENNANMGARRVREAIYAVLPPWFTEEAKTLCHETLRRGEDGAPPLQHRIGDAIRAYKKDFDVTLDQLETKLGRPKGEWDEQDWAQLGIIHRSLRNREVRVEDEFPSARIDSSQITGATPAAAPAEPSGGADEDARRQAAEERGGWPPVPAIPGGEG